MQINTSFLQHQQAIAAGELSCRSLVAYYLERIERNLHLNAFVEVYEQEALAQAGVLDRKRNEGGKIGRLHGLVLGVKDVICHKGHQVTASSKMLGGFESLITATALQRLLDEDAIVIGRLNCDEFAMGSSNEYSVYGAVRNAADPTRVAGGSSGGSAVAVQADLCGAALGSDTGGSVRQPAAFCGVVGCKPTYGRISRHGLIAYASSFDQIGSLTRTVEEAALLLEIMAGHDHYDATAATQAVPSYSQQLNSGEKRRLAYYREALYNEGLDSDLQAQMLALIAQLRKEGHTVDEITFPDMECMIPTYYVLTAAEASSNLSRYDGTHYGYRTPVADSLEQLYRNSRSEGFGREVQRRIMLGTFVLSSGYYDAFFTKAQKVRRLIADTTLDALRHYDFLLSPTTPDVAFGLGEMTKQSPVQMYLADIFTVQANLAGVPAVSLPLLRQRTSQMPLGVQLMAGYFEEAKLLDFSAYLCRRFSNFSETLS